MKLLVVYMNFWDGLGDNIGVILCACRRERGLGLHGK